MKLNTGMTYAKKLRNLRNLKFGLNLKFSVWFTSDTSKAKAKA